MAEKSAGIRMLNMSIVCDILDQNFVYTFGSCGQSYKASTNCKYKQFTSNYDSGVIIYERKMFIRLATGGLIEQWFPW